MRVSFSCTTASWLIENEASAEYITYFLLQHMCLSFSGNISIALCYFSKNSFSNMMAPQKLSEKNIPEKLRCMILVEVEHEIIEKHVVIKLTTKM